MDASVDVGVVACIVFVELLENLRWLLRGGGAVQINKGPAVDLLVEDLKVRANTCPELLGSQKGNPKLYRHRGI